MRVRPGRLLPSVMVGGLLVSGLALGAGVASGADATCKSSTGEDVPALGVLLIADASGSCQLTAKGKLLYSTVDAATTAIVGGAKEEVPPAPVTTTSPVKDATDGTKDTDSSTGGNPAVVPTTTTAPRQTAPAPAPVLAGPAAALPPAAPAALGAAGPVGALPPLAGVAPAGLASNLFSANAYDPGLLFGTPLGNAASALFSPKADSAVTTVSQAQLLPSAGSGGFGTPATIGVIILACLIGFAVRHRVISRMKKRELPAAEYQPRHAAVETEPEADPATEPHAPDEARTLVVLSRR